MSTSTVNTIISNMVADVGSVLSTNIPLIIGIVAALIGLGFLIRFFKRHIGHKA